MTDVRDLVLPPLERPYAKRVRPVLQYVVSVLLACALLPIGLVVGLANLVHFRDPRRILFTQERRGLHGQPFKILKFRTMRDLPQGQSSVPGCAADVSRVTRLGRFLRNTHLDEIPQLINVLRGEMSLIGPRPEMTDMELWAQARVPGFADRLVIRPGITGYAQITQGYAPKDVRAYELKLALNQEYLERVSLGMDLAILLRTCVWVITGCGWDYSRIENKHRQVQPLLRTQPTPVTRSHDPVPSNTPVGSGVDAE